MIYKMRGWTWDYTHKHPSVVGKWINDLIYERLAPLVLSELRRKIPKLKIVIMDIENINIISF